MQAAFEAIVLGENPEVLEMEMKQKQRRSSMPTEEPQVAEDKKGGCCVLM